MLGPDVTLSVQLLRLDQLIVTEFVSCFPEKLLHYIKLLQEHPGQYFDPIMVKPLEGHVGLFAIQNGKHRFLASIMAGDRTDIWCVVQDHALAPQ